MTKKDKAIRSFDEYQRVYFPDSRASRKASKDNVGRRIAHAALKKISQQLSAKSDQKNSPR